jgi:quercetin dioxygenase-like cupin family protein
MRQVLITSAAIAALLASATYIAAAEEAPKDNKGFTAPKNQIVDLGPEIEGMAGRQLRMRVLKIEPGGHIGLHTHKNRPAVVYFLEGTDTVIQADGSSKTFHPGDMSGATKDTTHWHRNDGKDDVLLIAVDVFQPAPK